MNFDKDAVKKYWFARRIEDLPADELERRTKEVYGMNLIDGVITTLPYVGVDDNFVSYSSEELIALCPATGYPDLYTIDIRYVPGEVLVELKSLKFYLMQYLHIPISHEHLASKILEDLTTAIAPKRIGVALGVAIRGGIRTRIMVGDTIIFSGDPNGGLG